MEWLKNNFLSLIIVCLLGIIIYQQIKTKQLVEEARSEAAFTNSKLDYVESEINEKR